MPALNFQAQFAPLVASCTKTQTIRARRKDGRDPKVGDRLYLYTGMRTKRCKKLGEAICYAAYPVEIKDGGVILESVGTVYRAGTWKADEFARNDGFADFEDMRNWFDHAHGLPFRGVMVRWQSLEKGA